MGAATNLLVQSKYFLPIFNMAIFDGPFRLYFSHAHESEALRLYFELHEVLGERTKHYRAQDGKALFVLLFPDDPSYENAFGNIGDITLTHLGESEVLGIKGPTWSEEALTQIISRIDEVFTESSARSIEASPV